MKIAWTTNSHPQRQKVGSLLISPRTPSPGAFGNSNATTTKNNWRSIKAKFWKITNAIRYVDAAWSGLTAPQQQPWKDTANNMPGAKICGCPYLPMDGQKLFRAINLNNAMTGQPLNLLPPSLAPYAPFSLYALFSYHQTPVPYVQLDSSILPADTIFEIRQNAACQAISVVLPAGPIGIYNWTAPHPFFTVLDNIGRNATLPWCAARAIDRLPLSSGFANYVWEP